MDDKQKVIVICGPTASGKTGLSLKVAQKFSGEIISADSMQIYKNLDIGTAKATAEEQSAAPHHLIDILTPDMPHNVQNFVNMAEEKISEISSRKNLPIIVGGTGLYIESLLNGIQFSQQPDNSRTKQALQQELLEYGKEYMYNLLKDIDPEYAEIVHPNNTVRVLRAIEIFRLTGKTMSQQLKDSKPTVKPYNSLIIGLTCTDRQILYERINKRVDEMLLNGLLDEAAYVFKNKDSFRTCVSAIGYKEFFPYFNGTDSLECCTEKLKQASRNYAKRQLTWFNRMKDVNWLFCDEKDCSEKAIQLVEEFMSN